MNRILLQDLTLYDGTGSIPFQADILLEGEKILQVEKASSTVFSCVEKRSYPSCSISPGWIDAHAHSDASILASPEAYSKITQGITTEVSGNCGLSAFPVCSGEVREHLQELYKVYDLAFDWHDFASYADAVDKVKPAVNVLFLCGHNTLRASISGYKKRSLTEKDLVAMQALLHTQLTQGAAGFSTGLLYTPGCFSTGEELLQLLILTARHNKVHATHLRNEGDTLEEALGEALSLSCRSGCTLLISHLKTALPRNWHKLSQVLAMIEKARSAGGQVYADRYPYTHSQTSLSIVLGEPFDTMDDRSIEETLQNDQRQYEKALAQLKAEKRNWDQVILSSTRVGRYASLAGRTLSGCAAETGLEAEELVMDLLRENATGTMGAFGGLSAENLNTLLLQDYLCCGSDETARPADRSLGTSHPRGFGSMVRFIRLCRLLHIPMEKIVQRMTFLPAGIFGMKDRGIIAAGMKADLTLFREDLLQDKADFVHPHAPCEGIEEVFVNGVPHFASGERSGKVIRIPGR